MVVAGGSGVGAGAGASSPPSEPLATDLRRPLRLTSAGAPPPSSTLSAGAWIGGRLRLLRRRGLRVGLRPARRPPPARQLPPARACSASAARSFSSSRCTASSCETLLLDLLQPHDLGLGLRLERLERLALGLRLGLLVVEIGADVLELVDRGREVVHVRQRAPGGGAGEDVGGRLRVHAVDGREQRVADVDRPA